MKLSFDEVKGKDEVDGFRSPLLPSTLSNPIKRIWHTRTEFTIYPNGKIFPGKTQAWFEDKIYEHIPKEKAVAKESPQTQINETEEY